jgi:hypothetical protein
LKLVPLLPLLFINLALADGRQIDDHHWEGVERVVAIGDLHGDYENYLQTLQAAGLVDKRGRWDGGETHFVQTGDIPDRGPDTEKIIDHISKLAKQAKRKGGRVHSLIGNHEVMNVYGDLRYVHEGEYEAFVTRNSEAYRDRYFELYLQSLQTQDPEGFAALPEDYRQQWNEKYPLGWVEHRQAWDPAWNPDAKYAQWVLAKQVAIQVNDSVFVHGGISGYYCQNTLESMTDAVRAKLADFDPQNPGIIEDEFGPLWYRGLSGVEPEAPVETVDAILEQHGARRIVVGHTPTNGVIWPRYDAKVVVIDTGIAQAYGGYIGYLEIGPDGLFAGYPGGKLPLPPTDEEAVPYLEQVIAMDPDNRYLRQLMARLTQPPAPEAEESPAAAAGAEETGTEAAADGEEREPMPVCRGTPL